MRRYNLNNLFYSGSSDSYEKNITLSANDRDQLMEARKAIRAHIRSQIARRLRGAGVADTTGITPKFITQGSFAYHTVNAPAYPPRQQADLDDGVYVPLSFCEETGSPDIVSDLLLDIVEATLTDIAKRKNWGVDTSNPNCTRLIIAHDKHVDMPIYSIPDAEFRRIAENRLSLAKTLVSFAEFCSGSYLDDRWELMPDRVLMAHKTKGWIDSDPRPVNDWVDLQVELKSEQLRRLIRYLKAWRDHQDWPKNDPKSILIMALVDKALDRKIDYRDDLALIKVCSRIPEVLLGSVEIPALPGEDLARRLDEDGLRSLLSDRIRGLHDELLGCVNGKHSKERVCLLLQKHFGSRLPNQPNRVRIERPDSQKGDVKQRVIAPAPIIGRRRSG